MPQLRSAQSTRGRNAAGARALWRATGVKDSDFGKPIIAIATHTRILSPDTYTSNTSAILSKKPSKRLVE